QIRVHLMSLGAPLVGDPTYGGPTAPRMCLHATRLVFQHPDDGREVALDCPPGDDFWAAGRVRPGDCRPAARGPVRARRAAPGRARRSVQRAPASVGPEVADFGDVALELVDLTGVERQGQRAEDGADVALGLGAAEIAAFALLD